MCLVGLMKEINVSSEYFDIKKTLECGQIFRYFSNGDGSFRVYSKEKVCYLYESGGSVTIKSDDVAYFESFFDLSRDYKKIYEGLAGFSELSMPLQKGKGIRILRQDLFETVISFIVSQNNNIKRIQGIIERLSECYGEKQLDGHYAFPSPESLLFASYEDLKKLGLGYRASFILPATQGFLEIKDNLLLSDTPTAEKLLISLKGIGPKVADCILLFGLSRFDSFPVDTWIFKAGRTDVLTTKTAVRNYYLERYGDYAGYAQQLMFYAARES